MKYKYSPVFYFLSLPNISLLKPHLQNLYTIDPLFSCPSCLFRKEKEAMMTTHTTGNSPDAESLLDRVNTALASQASEVVFAVGGSIDVSAPGDAAGKQQYPLTIRYDSREKEHGLKVELPVHIDDPSQQAL